MRALRDQSCEWFYDQIRYKFKRFGGAKVVRSLYKRRAESDSENDSGYDPSTSVCSRESSDKKYKQLNDPANTERLTSTEIHQHIETLVESLVGEALDNAHIDKIYKHPEYKSDGPEDPTSAHVALKHIICEVSPRSHEIAMFTGNASASSPTSSSVSQEDDIENHNNLEEDFSSYEDVLASAILNKVIERYQKKSKSTEETGTDTDDLQHSSVDVNIQSDAPSNRNNESIHSETSSLDEESVNEDFSWAEQDHFKEPIAYVIEEHIEEITTETYNTDSEDESKQECILGGSPPGVDEPIIPKCKVLNEFTIPELDNLYPGLDFVQTHKVPFPEFGMDIVDIGDNGSEDIEYDTTSTVVTPIDSWEENWLFKKMKKPVAYGTIGHRHLGRYDDPICMLIPNPSESVSTRVGSLDIDELSDLSERNSVGSLEFSFSDESADEEMKSDSHPEKKKVNEEVVPEFSQKDLEYTIDYYKESDKLHHPIRPTAKRRQHLTETNLKQNDINKMITPSKNTQTYAASIVGGAAYTGRLVVVVADRETSKVNNAIRFISKPESTAVHSGKTARIFAQIDGKQPFDVAWYYHGSLIKDGGRFQLYWCNGNKFCLDIFDTDVDDSGPYSCVAFNENKKQIWTDFNVKVKSSSRAENPPEFASKLEDKSTTEGNPVRLSCKVSGYPEPQVIFYFKNKKLQNDKEYYIDNLGFGDWTIEIPTSNMTHNGLITACARNKVGEVNCSAKIIVESDSSKRELNSLTKRVNKAQKDMEIEAQHLLDTASQLSSLSDQLNIANNSMKAMETLVVQRTWEERQNELQRDVLHHHFSQQSAANALRRTTGRALDMINTTTRSGLKQSLLINNSEEKSLFSTPPKPGTVADREHKKWLQADVPMPNNPYTPENVAKRKNSLISNGLPCGNNSEMEIPGRRPVEIPSRTWRATVHQDMAELNIEEGIALGQVRWRRIIASPTPNMGKDGTINELMMMTQCQYKGVKCPNSVTIRKSDNEVTIDDDCLAGPQHAPDVKIPDDNPQKIDCGLKQIESERYQRDYYINDLPVPAQRKAHVPKPMPRKCNNVLTAEKEDKPKEKTFTEKRMNDKLNVVEEKREEEENQNNIITIEMSSSVRVLKSSAIPT
ncbi:Myosin light chain kinase, smooth muscle [Nymphon striatum]|nr:Myosin light chain kinase, smooth muscle [Nymphon striatum]